jgi:RND family efflux transporter MFP subunit
MLDRMSFRTLRALLIVAGAVGVAALLIVLGPKPERRQRAEPVPLVQVLAVQPVSVTAEVEGYGTVRATETLRLVAEVRGKIVALDPRFIEGGRVAKDSVLLTIDPEPYRLEVARQKALVDQARAETARIAQEKRNLDAQMAIAEGDLNLARAELERFNVLARRQVVSDTNRDQTERRYLTSQEKRQGLANQAALIGPLLEKAEAQQRMVAVQLDQARLDLKHTRVVAPFEGWVTLREVELGQHVSAGQLLGQIYRHGALEVEMAIGLDDLPWLEGVGKVNALLFTGRSGSRSENWTGTLARFKAAVDEKTRTLPAVVAIDNKGSGNGLRLKPGMFVTVILQGRPLDNVVALPRHVLQADNRVIVVRDGRLQLQPVDVTRIVKETVYVGAGLGAGDQVVVTPLAAAVADTPVKVQPADNLAPTAKDN